MRRHRNSQRSRKELAKQPPVRLQVCAKDQFIKSKLVYLAALFLLPGGLVQAQTNQTAISEDRVSIYQVPLVCPAVPEIGCGSHAKPVLLALEREPAVSAAWLNRQGNLLAVVWKPDASARQRSVALKHVSKSEGLQATPLKGKPKTEALRGFLSGQGWFRGAEVDRLSREEAGALAH